MSSKLEIKDPVFASFLISRGCKLLTIEPYCPPDSPKKYIFDGSVRNGPYEAEFLGAVGQGAKTTWLDFKNRIENLQAREIHLLHCHSSRTERNGKETWLGQDVFVTSSQVIAAFLLSRKIQIHGAKEMRKGNYLFAFLEHEKASELTLEMLSGEAEGTWYEMKEKYKHATSLRLHFCRKKTTPPKREPQQLRASGTNG